jgi:hypothetical protein
MHRFGVTTIIIFLDDGRRVTADRDVQATMVRLVVNVDKTWRPSCPSRVVARTPFGRTGYAPAGRCVAEVGRAGLPRADRTQP